MYMYLIKVLESGFYARVNPSSREWPSCYTDIMSSSQVCFVPKRYSLKRRDNNHIMSLYHEIRVIHSRIARKLAYHVEEAETSSYM